MQRKERHGPCSVPIKIFLLWDQSVPRNWLLEISALSYHPLDQRIRLHLVERPLRSLLLDRILFDYCEREGVWIWQWQWLLLHLYCHCDCCRIPHYHMYLSYLLLHGRCVQRMAYGIGVYGSNHRCFCTLILLHGHWAQKHRRLLPSTLHYYGSLWHRHGAISIRIRAQSRFLVNTWYPRHHRVLRPVLECKQA